MAQALKIPAGQIEIVPVNVTTSKSRAIQATYDIPPAFTLKVVISFSSVPSNQSTDNIKSVFSPNSTSLVNNYFSSLDIDVVNVSVAVETVESTTIGALTGLLDSAENIIHNKTKSLIEKYLLYIVVGVPCVLLVAGVIAAIVIVLRRRANVMRRKRIWEMHNMYSSISLVDYT